IPGTKRVRYLEENVAATGVEITAEGLAALEEAVPAGRRRRRPVRRHVAHRELTGSCGSGARPVGRLDPCPAPCSSSVPRPCPTSPSTPTPPPHRLRRGWSSSPGPARWTRKGGRSPWATTPARPPPAWPR